MAEHRTFRALGGVDQGALPAGEVADALRAEFERVFTLKSSLRGEAQAGVSPTGRAPPPRTRPSCAPWWPASRGPAGSPSASACSPGPGPGPVGRGHGQRPVRRLGRGAIGV